MKWTLIHCCENTGRYRRRNKAVRRILDPFLRGVPLSSTCCSRCFVSGLDQTEVQLDCKRVYCQQLVMLGGKKDAARLLPLSPGLNQT